VEETPAVASQVEQERRIIEAEQHRLGLNIAEHRSAGAAES
jgi:hypothetical protein